MKRLDKIQFIHFDSIPSTNSWVKEQVHQLDHECITCVTASEQTAGRGRQNRKWLSPKHANLYLTLFLVLENGASYACNLSQIMALAWTLVLEEIGLHAELKWPNDILIKRKKIGGILTETIAMEEEKMGAVIGTGFNVNMPESMLAQIEQPAASLNQFLSYHVSPFSLVEPLISRFLTLLKKLQNAGFSPFKDSFESYLAYKSEPITIKLPDKTIEGICEGITKEGCLKLKLRSGQMLTLSMGEIL